MNGQECLNCKFGVPASPMSETISCRRYPATVVTKKPDVHRKTFSYVFPEMRHDEWCGEYQSDPGAPLMMNPEDLEKVVSP